MSGRDHMVTAVLLAIVGLYLIRLSAVEIQPWDEGLYAVRGEAMVIHDAWWDQTPHTLGGLYSSTPPPVASWGVAIGTTVFGRSALGVRFFTLLCSGIALWLIYRIGKQFLSFQGAMAAMIAAGTSLHWVVYSRQAMTEVPLMMFSLLGLFAVLRLADQEQPLQTRQQILGFSALAVLSIVGALLTKMMVGFLPVLFLLPLLLNRKTRLVAAGIGVLGLALAVPWYAMMIGRYGNEFWMAMSIPHLFASVEGNVGSMGPLYYVNQLLRAQPVIMAAFAFVGLALFKRTLLPERHQLGAMMVVLWFVCAMLVFSIAATKNPHYVVMIIPPAVLTAIYAFERIFANSMRRIVAILYSLLVVAAVYAAAPSVFTSLRTQLDETNVGLALALVALVLVTAVLPQRLVNTLVVYGYRVVMVLVLLVGGFAAARTVFSGRAEDIKGGRQVAVAMLEQADFYKEFAYLYHQHNAGDAMNPQLAWYTAGWMNGRDVTYNYLPIHMPAGTYDLGALAELAMEPLPWVVYYHPGMADTVITPVMAALSVAYDVHENMDHYTLFIRR